MKQAANLIKVILSKLKISGSVLIYNELKLLDTDFSIELIVNEPPRRRAAGYPYGFYYINAPRGGE